MKKISIVGIGPGNLDTMTFEAHRTIRDAEVVVGYTKYIELVEELIKGKEVFSSAMKKEVIRCEKAMEYALEDKTVALISSGDSGIYGMAGVMHEVLKLHEANDVEVEVIAGVTAATASAALLGAPLMHDFATISLSDLLTPWELIEKRILLSSQADFVICIYNPKSKKRTWQIEKAREEMLKYKSANTPVGIVTNAGRDNTKIVITNLEDMLLEEINMFSVVIVGNANTKVIDGKMITPRGYPLKG